MQTSSTKIGSWESHTKGFGSKMLKKFGWKEGQSIGKNSYGLIEPLNCEAKRQFDEEHRLRTHGNGFLFPLYPKYFGRSEQLDE